MVVEPQESTVVVGQGAGVVGAARAAVDALADQLGARLRALVGSSAVVGGLGGQLRARLRRVASAQQYADRPHVVPANAVVRPVERSLVDGPPTKIVPDHGRGCGRGRGRGSVTLAVVGDETSKLSGRATDRQKSIKVLDSSGW